MKIGIDISFIVQDTRGMGRYVRNALKFLLTEEFSHHDYTLFYGQEQHKPAISEILISLAIKGNYTLVPLKLCSRYDIDICWFPWNRIDVVPKTAKRVITIHDISPFVFPYQKPWRYYDQKKDENRFKNAAKLSDLIFTVSNFSKTEICKYLKTPKEKVKVIYSGVENYFKPCAIDKNQKENLYKKLNFDGEFILFVGADDERKNLSRLLNAYAILKKRGEFHYKLVLCGVGQTLRGRYDGLLNDSNIQNDVIFIGEVLDKELLFLYNMATVFVLPSLYEGFGFPVLEAMASGTPVVCSNCSSIPEVAGNAAIFFDPYNSEDIASKIEKFLKDESLRRSYIDLGFEQVKKFSWARAGVEILENFEKLLELDG